MASTRPRAAAALPLSRRHFSALEAPLHHCIQALIQSNDYTQIPHLLHHNPTPSPNPFSFLADLPPPLAAGNLSSLLRSFLALRPRSLALPSLSLLLSLFLPNPNPNPNPNFLPLALLSLQSTIRLGLPVPHSTRPALSLSWIRLRPVPAVLSPFDLTTANYLLSALCTTDAVSAALEVLRFLPSADSESYSILIEAMGAEGEALVRAMVAKGMVPRRRAVSKVVNGMRAKGEARRAAELVGFLEMVGYGAGLEAWEAVVEGWLEKGEVVAAARATLEMAARGFVVGAKAKRRVVEGLKENGMAELAGEFGRKLPVWR